MWLLAGSNPAPTFFDFRQSSWNYVTRQHFTGRGGGGGGRVAGLGLVISNTSQKLSIGGTYFSQCKTWRIRVRWISRWKFESVASARRVWDSNPRLETSRRFWRALVFAQIVPEILFWLCSSIVQRIEDVLGYIILEIQKKIFVKLCEKITEEKAVLQVNGTLHVKKSGTSPTLGA